jgi:hypothetical protein
MKRIFGYGLLICMGLCSSNAFGQAAIQEIEVNQALGKQLNGALNFVAGKNTAIRVYLSEETAVVPDKTKLVVEKDGTVVATLEPKGTEGPVKVVDFLCPSREACGNWAAGTYVFKATVNDVNGTSEGKEYVFKERQKLRIMVRPVKANYAGVAVSLSVDRWKKAWDFLQSVFPVAADAILWDIKDEFDAFNPETDVETPEGRLNLWKSITELVPQHCTANPAGEGCYDLVVGFIDKNPNGNLQGYTFGRPTSIVVATDQDMQATIPHEIAHIYDAGDTYTGGSLNCKLNPPPDGSTGKDIKDGETQVTCNEGRTGFPGASATLIPADARPYEVTGRGPLGDSACFMGSDGQQASYWITQEVYDRLFVQLDPALKKAQKASVLSAGTPERLLYFSGTITADRKFIKDPFYTYMWPEIPAPSDATTPKSYALRALNAAGTVVASQKLDVKFYVNDSPPRTLTEVPLVGSMLFPSSSTLLRLVYRDGATESTLWESKVPGADPLVSAVFASATEKVEGEQTMTWTASHPEGLPLLYMVEYNSDVENPASEWDVLATDLKTPSFQEDFSFMPGGAKARIRVTATDGIRAFTAESKTFSVPFKAPEVFIDDVPESIKVGTTLVLSAEWDDLQDDEIPDANLVWTSSIAGKLGVGTDIVVAKLAPGDHVITFEATNKAGLKGTQSVTVKVQ